MIERQQDLYNFFLFDVKIEILFKPTMLLLLVLMAAACLIYILLVGHTFRQQVATAAANSTTGQQCSKHSVSMADSSAYANTQTEVPIVVFFPNGGANMAGSAFVHSHHFGVGEHTTDPIGSVAGVFKPKYGVPLLLAAPSVCADTLRSASKARVSV